VEFGHPLVQCSQTWCHLGLNPFVFDEQGEQKFVHPLQLDVHIHQERSFLRVFLGAFEGSIDVFLAAVMVKR
jgi:hypothetical protein